MFASWAAEETAFEFETIGDALAHRVGDATARAYRRTNVLAKRRLLMAAWARFLIEPVDAGDKVPAVHGIIG